MAVRWRSLISEYDPPDGFRDIQVSARTIAGITAPQEHEATGAIPPRNLGSRRQQQPAPFVEQAFREFLTCGVLVHGFTRLRCADCRFEQAARLVLVYEAGPIFSGRPWSLLVDW